MSGLAVEKTSLELWPLSCILSLLSVSGLHADIYNLAIELCTLQRKLSCALLKHEWAWNYVDLAMSMLLYVHGCWLFKMNWVDPLCVHISA